MNKNLLIIGDVFYDKIYFVDNFVVGNNHVINKEEDNIGGIGNILKVLKFDNFSNIKVLRGIHEKTNLEEKIINHLDIGNNFTWDYFSINKIKNSTIIVDKKNNQRTSIVNWNKKFGFSNPNNDDLVRKENNKINKSNPKWIHLMYVDMFDENFFKFFEKPKNTILSIDFCQNNHPDEKFNQMLFDFIKEKVNFVFCGREEYISFFKDRNKSYDLFHKTKINYILHTPQCCYLCYEGETIEIMNNHFDNSSGYNVLGAGDYFSGLIINELIKGKINRQQFVYIIKKAQKNVLKYIKL